MNDEKLISSIPTLTSRIRQDIQSMHAYAVQDSAGMVKLDAMENPHRLPAALQAHLGQRLGALAAVAALTFSTLTPAAETQRWFTKRAKGPMVTALKPAPAMSAVSAAAVVPTALALQNPLPRAQLSAPAPAAAGTAVVLTAAAAAAT